MFLIHNSSFGDAAFGPLPDMDYRIEMYNDLYIGSVPQGFCRASYIEMFVQSKTATDFFTGVYII